MEDEMKNKTIIVIDSLNERPGFCSYSINFYKPYVSCRKSDLSRNQKLFSNLLGKGENILLDGYNKDELTAMILKSRSLGYEIINVK